MKKLVLVAGAALTAGAANAAGTAPDVTTLSSAVDFSTVSTAILAAGGLGIAMKLAMVAVRYVRRVVGGA